MKKYVNPNMDINVFDAESIVTISGGETGYNNWIEKTSAATGELKFADSVAVDPGK